MELTLEQIKDIKKAEGQLEEAIKGLVAARTPELKEAVSRLVNFRVWDQNIMEATLKAGAKAQGQKYDKQEATYPFFTEAVLYTLVGKEDARTILALLGGVARAAGFGGWWEAQTSLRDDNDD